MKNLFPLFAGVALFATGCMKDETDDTDFIDTDPDTTAGPSIATSVWGDTGYSITIDNAPDGGFSLGLAETGTADDTEAWYGEDCHTGTAGYTYCHGFDGSTGSLTALTGTDRDPNNVVEGVSTLLNQSLAMDGSTDLLTYMVTFDDGSCLVWGNDVGYYDSFSCDPG